MFQLLWETALWFLRKLNRELPYGPTVPHLGTYLREVNTYVHTKTYTVVPLLCNFSYPQSTMGCNHGLTLRQKVSPSLLLCYTDSIIHLTSSHHAGIWSSPITTRRKVRADILREIYSPNFFYSILL